MFAGRTFPRPALDHVKGSRVLLLLNVHVLKPSMLCVKHTCEYKHAYYNIIFHNNINITNLQGLRHHKFYPAYSEEILYWNWEWF